MDMQLLSGLTELHPYRGQRGLRGMKKRPDANSENATVNLETMRRFLDNDKMSMPKLTVEDGSKESITGSNSGMAVAGSIAAL